MKKQILFLVFFCAIWAQQASAQYVTIPDANFRAYLMAGYPDCFNASEQMDTTCFDVETVSSLNVSGLAIVSLEGLQYFKNLQELDCSNNPQLSCLPPWPNATQVEIQLDSTDIACLPSVSYHGFSIYLPPCDANNNPNGCAFTALGANLALITDRYFREELITNYPSCFTSEGYLDTVCAANATNTHLEFYEPRIRTLYGLHYFKQLTHFALDLVDYSYVDSALYFAPHFKFPINLTHLSITNAYNDVNYIPTLPATLKSLYLSDLHIGSNQNNFLSNANNLDSLIISYCDLTNLSNLPSSLTYLDCGGNNLTSLPNLPSSLTDLYCGGNENLNCLPLLPNGLISLETYNTNIACLPNIPAGIEADNSLPICTPDFNPNQCIVAGSFPRIAGYVFVDANNNGVKDAGETPRVGVKVSVPANNYAAYTNAEGFYEIAVDTLGTYTAVVTPPTYFAATPVSHTVTFTASETIEKNFALTATQTVKDMQVTLHNISAFARPGFPLHFRIKYENAGSVAGDAVVKFEKLALYTVNASTPAHTVVDNQLVWTIPNVAAGQTGYINIEGALSSSTTLGSTQTFLAFVNANDAAETTPANNLDTLAMVVRGSYDPNDKQATPVLTPAQVANGQFIDYTIRFQNTGTDTAFTVAIADTLANTLQANTLEIISSSHNMAAEVKGESVSFKFENILLPDSNVNEPRSHGFVSFRVRPQTTLVLGDEVANTAAIYFDFNAPIITNTIITKILQKPTAQASATSATICEGSVIQLNAENVANATYAWLGPNGFTSSAQNPSITSATPAASGTYTLVVTSFGLASNPSTVSVTVNAKPTAQATAANAAICEGTAIQLNAQNVANANYVWSGPNGFTSSAQNPSIAVSGINATGTYSLIVTANGCSSAASTVSVTVNAKPAMPVISMSNDTLLASSAGVFTWSLNGNVISTGNNNFIVPTAAGVYTVFVTNTNACISATSAPLVITGVSSSLAKQLRVYPNPSTGTFYVSATEGITSGPVNMSVYDLQGKVVYENVSESDAGRLEQTLDLGALANGMYFLKVSDAGRSVMIRLAKNK